MDILLCYANFNTILKQSLNNLINNEWIKPAFKNNGFIFFLDICSYLLIIDSMVSYSEMFSDKRLI